MRGLGVVRVAARRFRVPAITAAALLVPVAATTITTQGQLVRLYAAARTACAGTPSCPRLDTFAHVDTPLRIGLGLLVLLAPALIGAFWGAPLLAREYENGTHRLAFTQQTSPARWLTAHAAVVTTAALLATALLSTLVTWWAGPLDRAGAARYATFDQRDAVPTGYALFAVALGVAAGLAIRRTVPAMAVTLAAYIVVRVTVTTWIRPLLAPASLLARPLDPDSTGYAVSGLPALLGQPANLDTAAPDIPDAWIRSNRIVDTTGHAITPDDVHAYCPTLGHDPAPSGPPPVGGHRPASAEAVQRMHDCVALVGARFHQEITWLPSRWYQPLQWREFAVYALAAALLGGYSWWRLARR